MLEHLERRDADLVVMSSSPRRPQPLAAQQLGRNNIKPHGAASLFIPHGVDGFVNLQTAEVSLNRILIPIDMTSDSQPVLDAVAELVDTIAPTPVEVVI